MTAPTVYVEVSEVTTAGLPAYDDITWTDVSATAVQADVSLGRSDELSEYGAGTLALRMLSPDPLEVGWLIRVRATAGATELPLFTGRITRIAKTPEPGTDLVTVALDATDITEATAAEELTHTPYAKAIAADEPLYYWPLGAGADSGSPWPARTATGLADGQPDSAMKFSEVYDWIRTPDVPALTGDFTIEFWIKTRFTIRKNWVAPIFSRGSAPNPSIAPIAVAITSEGLLFGVGTSAKMASVGISDGRTHHVACTFTASGSVKKVWVDGTDRTGLGSTLIAERWAPKAVNDTVIGYRYELGADWLAPFVGLLDEVAIYDRVLTGDEIAAHAALGRQGATATTLSQRVTDLLALAGFDASWINAHASADETDVYTKPVYEGTVMGELQILATAHRSRIHSDETGRLSVYGFDHFPEPVAHYSDEGDALAYLAAGFTLEQSRDDIANIVTGVQADGPELTVTDADSVARYGRHSADLGTIRTTSPGAVQTVLERHLDQYKTPAERFRSIGLAPLADDALWPALAASVVSSAVTVTYATATADYLVEGVTHSISPGDWRTTLALSPAPVDDFWRWAESELDTETRWA